MDWVKDRNKLFRLRPRYSRSEINSIAETKATSFLEKTYGCVKFPLRTEDLKNLVEECVEDLDLYHEFPEDEWDAEGVTIFSPGYLPSIKIASVLTETETRLNRFRSTLAHEGGHVILHSPAYDIEGNLKYPDDKSAYMSAPQRKGMEHDESAPRRNWMENDAFFFGAALLMPRNHVLQVMEEFDRNPAIVPVAVGNVAERLIDLMSTSFLVSQALAGVRLKQLFYFSDLTEHTRAVRDLIRMYGRHEGWYDHLKRNRAKSPERDDDGFVKR